MVKFARRDFTCWSDIHQTVNERCIDVCKALGEMITSSGTGWEYDSRTPVDTYLFIPSVNNTYQFPVSYFVNTVSGAKLMVMVNLGTNDTGSFSYFKLPYISNKNYLMPIAMNNYLESNSYNISQTGVHMAMIPAGSSSVFPSTIPNDYVTKFIPNDAIPIVTNVATYNSSSIGNSQSFLGSLSSSYIYSLGLLIESDVIMFLEGYSSTSSRSPLWIRYAIGKIIGVIAHEDDALNTAQYGAIRFTSNASNTISYYDSIGGNNNVVFYGRNISSSSNSDATNRVYGICYNAEGTPILTNCYYGPTGSELLSPEITNDSISNHVRWCPYVMAAMYDPGNFYITDGDGFKGYLDTNLFRAAICTKGNYYNEGAFVGFENNLLVAWDKDATDNIM